MTQRQIPTEPLRHSIPLRGLRYPRAVASACVAAFAAILALVPTPGTPQTGTPHPAGERQLGGPTYNDNIDDPAEWGKAFPKHYELSLIHI